MNTRTDTSDTAAPTACPDWVCPGMFRDHVRALICETGLSWRLVAAHADVSPRVVRALLHGREGGRPLRQLHVSVARALAATSVESIQEAETTRLATDEELSEAEALQEEAEESHAEVESRLAAARQARSALD